MADSLLVEFLLNGNVFDSQEITGDNFPAKIETSPNLGLVVNERDIVNVRLTLKTTTPLPTIAAVSVSRLKCKIYGKRSKGPTD